MLQRHLTSEDRKLIRELRERGAHSAMLKVQRKGERSVPLWTEQDVVKGNVTDTLSTVLSTRGCSWGLKSNCSMCGYFVDSRNSADTLGQFQTVMNRVKDEKFLKIYTSGSFLDPDEVSYDIQEKILTLAKDSFDRVLVESRPEYITHDRLETLTSIVDLEVAIGLESASDEVLVHSLNKGFSFQEYMNAATILREGEVPLRTYLILKPPFMSEGEAIRDSIASIAAIQDISETISINPMNIQNFTLVEHLFKRGEYEPPSLWSLIEVLRTSSTARLMSSPSGGGSRRGVHNCGMCDDRIMKSIQDFSLNQDTSVLEHSCPCRESWEDHIILEDAVQIPLP